MGLISWIKGRHYDRLLSKADDLVNKHQFKEAELIYRQLLGKHNLAAVHLANRFVLYSDGVDEKLSALNSIVSLNEFTDESNREAFDKELKEHVDSMEKLADISFEKKQFKEAVSLVDAIQSYKGDETFERKIHRYHAYLSFTKLVRHLDYKDYLDETITELKKYVPYCKAEIDVFVVSLKSQEYYLRAIKLLYAFISLDANYRRQIIDLIVEIALGKDADIGKPKKISDFCSDRLICEEAARELYKQSIEADGNKWYTKAVVFDSFASEFLSEDNAFNVNRCQHLFNEMESRADANEIKALLKKTNELNLTEQQKNDLKQRIASLAQNTTPEKGIEICKLFDKERTFNSIYIEQANKLASVDVKKIDAYELLKVISQCTDIDSYVDTLAVFVRSIPDYGKEFVRIAIDKILRHKSLPLLEKYWRVKEDTLFFDEIIAPSSVLKDDAVRFISDHHGLFLHDKKTLSSFLHAIDSLGDNSYAYNAAEYLHKQGCSVLNYYLSKAATLCNNKEHAESVNFIEHTLETIDFLHIPEPDWIPLYLRKRAVETASINVLSQKVVEYCQTIDTIIRSSANLDDYSDKSYMDHWKTYIDLVVKMSEEQPKEKAIEDLTEVRELIATQCKAFPTFPELQNTLATRITKLQWEQGKEYEEDKEYDNAIIHYKAIIQDGTPAYYNKAEYRFLICLVKSAHISYSIEQKIKTALDRRSYESLKEDLAYRYACLLLKLARPYDAKGIVSTYLPQESQFLELCNNMCIKESELKLSEFNDRIKAISENKLSLVEVTDFLNRFAEYKTIITRSLTDTTNKFISYERKIESYIIKSLFEEEQYEEALSRLVNMYPRFYEDDTNFRNVAIAALGVVESNEVYKEAKYKDAISIWLSAIYNDQLFVRCLDYTSWDDPYTFTLNGSLGNSNEDDHKGLPDNINFNEPEDNQNIAIASVQNSLIVRMENLIRDYHPEMEEFFNEEKESLDALIALQLDEKCFIVSPYLARQNTRALETIKDSFDAELRHQYDNEEDVLSLGVKYGFNEGKYHSYKEALDCAIRCKTAVGNNTQLLTELASLPKVYEFEKLFSSLKSFFSTKMSEDIRSKLHYKKFIDNYEFICKAFDDSSLSLAFSQYANGEVVHLLNDGSMKERDGAVLLARIYKIAPSSIQVKQNLEGVIRSLVRVCVKDNNQEDELSLNEAVRIAGPYFKKIADLSMIVLKVNNETMSKTNALDRMYMFYLNDKDNDEICANLTTLCDICIWEYVIRDSYESYSVMNILNKILQDRSTTFIKHSDTFASSYNKIMNGISPDNITSVVMGINLNSKGMAIRKGLAYFASFSPKGKISDPFAKFLHL